MTGSDGVPEAATIAAYDGNAARLAEAYEAVDLTSFRSTFEAMLPRGPDRLALDVGAGSGRDAAWLHGLGFDVVAVEPAAGMRTEAALLRPDLPIRWLDDRLPGLERTHALGIAFDVVLVSGVWPHVAPGDRRRAFRKLAALLRPGGLLVLTLRHGPAPKDRHMHEVSVGEVEALARDHGLIVSRLERSADGMARADVAWTTACLTLPDDGAGALPLLRGIILDDDKSATYKLGLLRAVAKVADLAPNLGIADATEDVVHVPLGAVALNWLRLYLPLIRSGLPQMPRNAGPDGLGFVKDGFRRIMAEGVASQDLRVGGSYAGDRATALAMAIADAARTLSRMPATHITFPNSDLPVFGTEIGRRPRGERLVLDATTLRAFGTMAVPGHVWRAMQRLGAWIEPVLVAEWSRLTRSYAERQGRVLAPGEVEARLAWVDPVRDVRVARDLALARMAAGETIHCVWSDRPLTPETIDVDHCLPWSAWPCSDLWNLMPARRAVNQRQKRHLLPSAGALAGAREPVVRWWQGSWLRDDALGARFRREVAAALPVDADAELTDVFAGLEWRRLRLRQDQQVTEWAGARTADAKTTGFVA